MATFNSDEEKYANESFEADSDCDSPEVPTDSEKEENTHKAPSSKILTNMRPRQMKLSGPMGAYPINRDALPFDSSSEDEDDVVFSETVAEINAEAVVYDTPNEVNKPACYRMPNVHQTIDSTDESDFHMKNRKKLFKKPEENKFVSDVSEELEMEMEMQVFRNQTKLTKPNSTHLPDLNEIKKPRPMLKNTHKAKTEAIKNKNSGTIMQELAGKIQRELHINSTNAPTNIDAVAKMVASAISHLSSDEACQEQDDDAQDTDRDAQETPRATPIQMDPMEELDLSNLNPNKSFTVFRTPAQFRNPFHRVSLMQANVNAKLQKHSLQKESNSDIEDNLDTPKANKQFNSSKLLNISSNSDFKSLTNDTEADCHLYEPKVEVRMLNNSEHSFRSDDTLQLFNRSRNSSSTKLNQSKSGQSVRKSWSFTNDRMRQIERENHILLQKILTQKPTIPMPKKQKSKYNYLPPTTFVSKATIERKKQQRQIDLDNQVLKQKIESVSFRRRPISYKT